MNNEIQKKNVVFTVNDIVVRIFDIKL